MTAQAVPFGVPLKTGYARCWEMLQKEIDGPEKKVSDVLDTIRRDPCWLMRQAGMEPDAWQKQVLQSTDPRLLMLCSRQSGKSTVTSVVALRKALLQPKSLTLLVSRSERQSDELFRKVMEVYNAAGRPVAKSNDMSSQLHLANGSRIVPLPGKSDTLVGFTVDLLVIDEAAKVPDPLYYLVRPMLIRSKGSLVALSTPFGKRGWFYDEWTGEGKWERVKITADQCPHLTTEDLAKEKLALGERWYSQEYLCSFEDAVGQVFSQADIDAMMSGDVMPLFPTIPTASGKMTEGLLE